MAGHAVARLDQGVDPIRVRGSHADADLSHRQLWQTVPLELGPGVAAISRHVDPAAGSAALAAPGVDHDLPHPREEDPRVVRIHLQAGGPRVLVHEEHVLPGLTAVLGAEDSSLGLRSVRVSQRCHIDEVRVFWVDDDPRGAARPRETHVAPRFTAVGGLVDAGAEGDVRADVGLARAHPDDIGIRRRHRDRPDGVVRLVVEDGAPADASVLRLPEAARSGAGVIGQRIPEHTRHGGHPVPHGADVAVTEILIVLGGNL